MTPGWHAPSLSGLSLSRRLCQRAPYIRQVNSPSLLADETGMLAAMGLSFARTCLSFSVGSLSRAMAFFSFMIMTLFVHFLNVSSAGANQTRATSKPRVFSSAFGTLIRGSMVEGIRRT